MRKITALLLLLSAAAPTAAQFAPIQRVPIPRGPLVQPKLDRVAVDLGTSGVARMSPLYALSDTREIETNRRLLEFKREGGFAITKPGDPITLEYLTHEKPAYPKAALLMTANTSDMALGALCGGLNGTGKIAKIDAKVSAIVADDEVGAAAAKGNVDPGGAGALYRVSVTGYADDDVVAAAAAGRKVAIRALPLDASGACLAKSAGGFVAQLSKPDPNFDPMAKWKQEQANKPAPVPYVAPRTEVVGYYAPIDRDQCAYIITKSISDPEFREVLKFWKISTAVGTHFKLCEGDITVAKNNMADSTHVKIFFENLGAAFAGAFNWTAGAFQSVAAAIAEPLGGSKYAQAFVQAMMGQLPGSPLTGNMDMVVDQGCGQLKQIVAAKIGNQLDKYKANGDNKMLSDEAKKQSDDLVQKTCDAVKNALQEKGSPRDYLQRDLDFAQRGAVAFVRVRYLAMDGTAPEGTLSKEETRTVVMHADNGISTLAPNGVGFQFDVMKGTLLAPPGRAGDSFIAAVPLAENKVGIKEPIQWSALITENGGLDVYDTYGYKPTPLHLIGWLNNVEPPAS